MAEIFRSAFNLANFNSPATVALVAGSIVRLGEYKVQAGELICNGFGEQTGQDNAVGRVFMKLMDTTATPVQIHGMVRLSVYSPQNRPLLILSEHRTEILASGETDRSLQTPYPEDVNWIQEDKKLVLEFIPDTTATFSKANSKVLMDMTVEEV